MREAKGELVLLKERDRASTSDQFLLVLPSSWGPQAGKDTHPTAIRITGQSNADFSPRQGEPYGHQYSRLQTSWLVGQELRPSSFLPFPSWLLILRSEPRGTLSNLLEQNITKCSCCGLGSQLPSLLLLESNQEVTSLQYPSNLPVSSWEEHAYLDGITSKAGALGSDWENGRRQKCSDGQMGKGRPHYALCFPH